MQSICSVQEQRGEILMEEYEDPDIVRQMEERKQLGLPTDFTSSEKSQRSRRRHRHTKQQVSTQQMCVEHDVMLLDEGKKLVGFRSNKSSTGSKFEGNCPAYVHFLYTQFLYLPLNTPCVLF